MCARECVCPSVRLSAFLLVVPARVSVQTYLPFLLVVQPLHGSFPTPSRTSKTCIFVRLRLIMHAYLPRAGLFTRSIRRGTAKEKERTESQKETQSSECTIVLTALAHSISCPCFDADLHPTPSHTLHVRLPLRPAEQLPKRTVPALGT